MIELQGKYTSAKIMIDDVEQQCISQIYTFLNHRAFTNPVIIMPDTHAGKGSVIGFTMKLTDKIIPNTVGVDVGCGVVACNLGKDFELPPLDLLDVRIREYIPMGFEINERKRVSIDDFPWKRFQNAKAKIISLFGSPGNEKYNTTKKSEFKDICSKVGTSINKVLCSVGTLGGGNHFIEIGKDTEENIWFTVHTGSRNLGLRICNYWQSIAKKKCRDDLKEAYKEEMAEIKSSCMGRERGSKLKELKDRYSEKTGDVPDHLEYLEGADAVGYLIDMAFAQIYADWNRTIIVEQMIKALRAKMPEDDKIVKSIHNFIDFDDMIIRKGAIRAYEGEQMVIPFNMRDGILICEGKSNPEWNCSGPHGAGRVLSRSAAKRELSLDEAKQDMEDAGIFTTNVPLDEAPAAYKDAEVIEKAIEPTAKILTKIKPIHNIKA